MASNNNNISFTQAPPSITRQSIEEASAEAEAKSLEYDPNSRAQYIRTIMLDIARWMADGIPEYVIKERIPMFVENYPELYKKIINKQDMAPIQSMLTMLDKMGEGNLSQHQASIIIGKKLVDRFVTPQLNGGNASHK